MKTMSGLLLRFYARLLHLYPAAFYGEFGEEMAAVFGEALGDARKRGPGALLGRCAREFLALPGAVARAHWETLSREETLMEGVSSFTQSEVGVEPPPETPWAMVAGTLPVLLGGLLVVLQAFYYPGLVRGIAHSAQLYLGLYAFLLVMLGVGWAKRFPRWSYGYLGIVLIMTLWIANASTPGLQLFGYQFGRELWGVLAWLPLLALVGVMLLLTRSLQPLRQLVRDVREDWSRLSFALYGAVTWVLLIASFDNFGWYNNGRVLLVSLLVQTVVFSAGAFLYMQRGGRWRGVWALQAALLLHFPAEWLAAGIDGNSALLAPARTVYGIISYLFLIALWVTPPLWPALVRGMFVRLREV